MAFKVSILGSGELGATLAQKLADSDWPGDVVLVDTREGPATGKALDLLESNPILGSDTAVRGARDISEIAGSSFVVLADYGAPDSPLERVEASRPWLEKLAGAAAGAVLVSTQADHARILACARAGPGWDAKRMIGVQPMAMVSRWKKYLGAAVGGGSCGVQVSLVGAVPQRELHAVFASVEGIPVERVLSASEMQSVSREVSAQRTPGPRALAAAAARLLEDMIRRRTSLHTCHVWSDGAYERRGLFICSPAVLSLEAGTRVLEVPLDPAQRVAVDRGLDVLARAQGVSW